MFDVCLMTVDSMNKFEFHMSMAHWQCFIGFYLFERYVDVNLQKCALNGFKFMKARYETFISEAKR